MTLTLSFKATGRMWLGMDSTAAYRPNRRNRYEVLRAVERACQVTFNDIMSENRGKKRVRARQLAAYFLRVCTDMSLTQIGLSIGNRHYSTICHALDRIRHRPHYFEPELTEVAVRLGVVAPHPPPVRVRRIFH
jgi:hypothetical protein